MLDQQQVFRNLIEEQRNLGQRWLHYWFQYSDFGAWQFWVIAALLIIPLIVLYFSLDREKIFQIGFYGFSVNLCANYIDGIGGFSGLWGYPYKVFPFLSMNITFEACLIPVAYMLVYQWCLNSQRNYYVYATLLSAFWAFVAKPIFVGLQLFQMFRGMNYLYLFLLYITGMLIAKWVTDLFVSLRNQRGGEGYTIRWMNKNRAR